jgi:hypothetical protein
VLERQNPVPVGPPKKKGRPPALDAKAVAEMQADKFLGDLTRDSNGKKEFSQAILNKMKEVAEGHNQNALAITKLCGKTNMKYIKEIGPEWCDRPSVQSARRYDALQRPVNHMSLAAVWRTIVFEEDDDEHLVQTIDDDCILNFDNTAILLRSPKTTARRLYCAVGSIAALKKLRLSPARTTKGREEKGRRERRRRSEEETGSSSSATKSYKGRPWRRERGRSRKSASSALLQARLARLCARREASVRAA